MITFIAAVAMQNTVAYEPKPVDWQTLSSWGRETIEMIRRDFYMPERRLYGDDRVGGKPPKQVAFNWGCGVMLSALNAAARMDRKYDPWLREYADATRAYWNPLGPVPGYDVLPAPKPVDRYYDDNQWMVMALVETYEHLHDRKYLDWAQETLKFVLSGESADLGGGIFWKETEKTSKNACSNAPAAAACLAVFRHTGDRRLLDKAIELYSWTKRTLMDSDDHLFCDSINLKGHRDLTKWTYNTALMIRTASELYDLTKLKSYALDAVGFEHASVAKWWKDYTLTDPGRFSHLLLDSWVIRRRNVHEIEPITSGVEPLVTLHDRLRSPDGYYPDRWNHAGPKATDKIELIDQASAARAFLFMAEYLKSPKRWPSPFGFG